MRIALQREPFAGHRSLQHVRTRPRDPSLSLVLFRGGGRNGIGERQRKLVEEVGVRCGEVEGDRAIRVIGHDALGEVARPRLDLTCLAADKPAVEICGGPERRNPRSKARRKSLGATISPLEYGMSGRRSKA